MKNIALSLLVAVSVASSACTIDVQGEESVVREQRRFAVSGTPDLTVRTFDGSIEIRPWDREEILVDVERRAGSEAAANAIVVDTSSQNGVVRNRGEAAGTQRLLRAHWRPIPQRPDDRHRSAARERRRAHRRRGHSCARPERAHRAAHGRRVDPAAGRGRGHDDQHRRWGSDGRPASGPGCRHDRRRQRRPHRAPRLAECTHGRRRDRVAALPGSTMRDDWTISSATAVYDSTARGLQRGDRCAHRRWRHRDQRHRRGEQPRERDERRPRDLRGRVGSRGEC